MHVGPRQLLGFCCLVLYVGAESDAAMPETWALAGCLSQNLFLVAAFPEDILLKCSPEQ